MTDGVWVAEGTLTLPYGTLQTLHYGVSEVRVYSNVITQTKQVGKRVSLLGREETAAVTEASLLREIDHPNVARVFDVTEVAGSDSAMAEYEIIMPFYEQGSVFDAMWKRGRRFSNAEARDLAVRALRGLAHLHDQHRLLHRDIKPANIFLADDDAHIKLGDFGEAIRMDEDGTAEPHTSPQFWTPPGSMLGDRYGVSSELYSLGLSLLEMLTGPFPYDSYTREDLASRLSDGKHALLPRHLAFAPQTPETLRRVVRKATRLETERRYQTAEEMIRDLLHARFVDWNAPETEPEGAMTWEGRWKDQSLRVTTRPVRGKGWRARGERRYSAGWRKLPQCPESDGPDSESAAATVLSHIDRHLARQ